MTSSDIRQRLARSQCWWMVRGESGALWRSLFQPRRVVAHGSQVPFFDLELDYEARWRAMKPLDEYGIDEVNLFLDQVEVDHAVVTPEAGSRAAWFGIITSDCFADRSQKYWMQRRCDWHEVLVPLVPAACEALRKGQLGTVFNVTADAGSLIESLQAGAMK